MRPQDFFFLSYLFISPLRLSCGFRVRARVYLSVRARVCVCVCACVVKILTEIINRVYLYIYRCVLINIITGRTFILASIRARWKPSRERRPQHLRAAPRAGGEDAELPRRNFAVGKK